MAKDKQIEPGLREKDDSCPGPQAPSTGWSIRWPGRPDPGAIRLPKVDRRQAGRLVSAIEDEVIPRLILSQRANVHESHAEAATLAAAGAECVDEFTNILLQHEVEVAYAYIDSIRVRGISLSAVYLELLAPAARVLGEMWEEDRCGFADVTVALCRLHEILRGLSATPPANTDTPPLGLGSVERIAALSTRTDRARRSRVVYTYRPVRGMRIPRGRACIDDPLDTQSGTQPVPRGHGRRVGLVSSAGAGGARGRGCHRHGRPPGCPAGRESGEHAGQPDLSGAGGRGAGRVRTGTLTS